MKIFMIIFAITVNIFFISLLICIGYKPFYCYFFEKELDRMWKFIYINVDSFEYMYEVNSSKHYKSPFINGDLIIFNDGKCAFFDKNEKCYSSFHPLSKKVTKILLNKYEN